MPELATWIAFIAATLAMQLTPGPDTMFLIGRGVGQGWRVACLSALGMAAAGLVQVPLLAAGVASLLQASPLAFDLLRWAGAAYLLWLGSKLLLGRSGAVAKGPAATAPVGAWTALRQGIVTNLLNPYVLAFMLAFLPQFADPTRGPVWAQLLALGTVQKLSGLGVNGATALMSGQVGAWLMRHPRWRVWQERLAGSILVGLGLRLLLSGEVRARG